MKKLKVFVLTLLSCLLLAFSYSASNVYADELNYMITVSISVPSNFFDELTITVTNTDTNKDYTFLVSNGKNYSNTFQGTVGTYTLKDVAYKSKTTNFKLVLNDFTISNTQPTWNVSGEVKLDTQSFKEQETTSSTGTNNPNTPNIKETENSNNINYVTLDTVISKDNAYFPNMSLNDISKWYVSSINDYLVSSNDTKHDLKWFTDNVDFYGTVVGNNDKIDQMKLQYTCCVEMYKDTNLNLYNIQAKMYDFISDYFKNNQLIIKFNWNDEKPNNENSTTGNNETTGNSSEDSTTINNPLESGSSNYNNGTLSNSNPTLKSKLINLIKKAWFSLLVIVLLIAGGLFYKFKYKKNDQ